MKVFLVICLCVAASARVLPGTAVSNQQSQVHGGVGVTGIAHGVSTADGGLGGAIANQKSKATGGEGSTLVADGESHATVQGGGAGGLGGFEGKYGIGHGMGHGGGSPAISNQKSVVHGGNGITGIANGDSTAQGGPGQAAISNQKSLVTGGAGSTLVADGTSSSSTLVKRNLEQGIYAPPGGVRVVKSMRHPGAAVSNQESAVHGGNDITGIANGESNAEGGIGGALSNQKSIATGKNGATLIADGMSSSTVVQPPRIQPRESRRLLAPGGLAISHQNSQAHAGEFGHAKAQGTSTANSKGGNAEADQTSGASAGFGGTADASGHSEANSFVKRESDPSETNTSDLISAAISGATKDAAQKIVKNPDALIASSKVNVSNSS